MKENKIPSNYELPSKGKLIRSTLLAILIAAAILITVVLPAEYGLDPTGLGEIIGLRKMGEIKVSLAKEAAIEKEAASASSLTSPEMLTQSLSEIEAPDKGLEARNDKFTISLEPNEGKEIKLTMSKGSTINYSWYTDGGKVNFDTHADSKQLQIKYHNYEKGTLEKSEGVLVAAFVGNHGWFWRNRTSKSINVTLEINGSYTDVLKF